MKHRLHSLQSSFTNNQGLKAQLVKGLLGTGGLNLMSLPLTLATSIILARSLGPDGYGQFVFILSLVTFLALPVGPGQAQFITREVARYTHAGEWSLLKGVLLATQKWAMIGSFIQVLISTVLAFSLAKWEISDSWTLLFIATFLIPLLAMNALRSNTLRGLGYVVVARLPELVIQPGVNLLLAAALLLLGALNQATAFVSQLLASGVALVVVTLFLASRRPIQTLNTTPIYKEREWAKAILPFTLLTAVGTLNGQIGILVLGMLGSNTEVASLRVAVNGSSLVSVSLNLINMVISPHIVHAHRENNRQRLQSLSRQSARIALLIATPIALLMIFWGDAIISIVYGKEYVSSAVRPLAILCTGQLINVAFGSVGLFLMMSGYEKETLYGQIIALVANGILLVVLVPILGATGAAISVAVGLVAWNAVLAFYLFRRLGFMPSLFG